jgi:hypothetical protein
MKLAEAHVRSRLRPGMPRTISLGRTFVLAGVAHAAVVLLMGRQVALGKENIHPAEPIKLVWIEPTPEALVVPPEHSSEPRAADLARSAVPTTSTTGRETTASPGAPAGSAVALPESAPNAPGGWTLHVTTEQGASDRNAGVLAALALDGKNHFMGKRETPEELERSARAEGNRQAGEAMRTALHDHDVSLGLGGGGPVVKALEEAVSVSTAPNASHAIIVAIADASGTVTQVNVESASADPASFQAVAADVLARLRSQKVRVPEGSHGISVRLDVASSVGPPSGGGAGLDMASSGAHFDLSDVGSRPRRIVHARILAEQIL